jgi:hypothetical protein
MAAARTQMRETNALSGDACVGWLSEWVGGWMDGVFMVGHKSMAQSEHVFYIK